MELDGTPLVGSDFASHTVSHTVVQRAAATAAQLRRAEADTRLPAARGACCVRAAGACTFEIGPPTCTWKTESFLTIE